MVEGPRKRVTVEYKNVKNSEIEKRFKVSMLGEANAGKTSLIHRFSTEKFVVTTPTV